MPKEVDHDARRSEIAHAAFRLIARDGFSNVTLRSIASELGSTTGLISHYYESKEALLAAALDVANHRSARRLATMYEAGDLFGFASASLPCGIGRDFFHIWLDLWAHAAHDASLRRVHRDRYVLWHDMLADLVRRCVPTPPFAEVDAIADRIMAFVDGLGVRALLDPRAWPAARQERELRNFLEQMKLVVTPAP